MQSITPDQRKRITFLSICAHLEGRAWAWTNGYRPGNRVRVWM